VALATAMTVTNAVALAAAAGPVDDRGNAVTLSGPVSGPGTLVKLGGGTLTLAVANTYTGGTVISQGTVRQQTPGALGTGPGPITLGDAGSDTNVLAWRFAAGTQPSNAIAVTALGTGPASLGSYNNSTFTEHRGPITLARTVTLVDGTADRTSFTGPISGNPGLIVISGTRITMDHPSNSFVAGLLINGGSIYQNNNTSALPFATTVTNNGAFRLNNGGRHVLDVMGGTGTVDIIAGGVSTLSLGNGNGSDLFAGRLFNGASALSLEKRGTGVQTLGNTNAYTGNTTILGGTLALSGVATLAGTPQIQVGAGATFDVSARPGYTLGNNQILFGRGTVTGDVVTAAGAQIRPDGFNSVNTLTFKNSLGLHAGSTNWFDLTGSPGVGGGTNDLVVVDGLLEPSNSVIQVNVLEPLASGTYTLFTYTGAKTTTFNPAPILSIAPGRKTATVDETTPGEVNLVVAGDYGSLVWLPQANGNWNFTDNNWSNLATEALDTFFQSDSVRFDERGAYSNVVTLTSTTQPTVVTVAGASNYTFQGAGRLQGLATLVKDGAGTLFVATTNTFTGPVVVSGGVLRVGHSSALGTAAGTTTVKPGGTLDINGVNLSTEPVVAEGGAVLNQGAAQISAFTDFQVLGDTLIGGTNRWDVRGATARTLVAGGATLTKAAGAEIVYLGVDGTLTNDGVIAVNLGRLGLWNTAIRGTGSFTVAAGGLLAIESATINSQAVTLAGGGLGAPTGTTLARQDGPVTLTAASLLVATAGPFAVNGAIGDDGGAQGLTKSGGSIVYLSASNTYRGGTTLAGGNIYLQNEYGLGTGSVNIASGSLDFLPSNGTTMVVANDIALPAVGTAEFWVRGTPSQFTTVRLTGIISGGAAGQQYNIVDTGVGGNHFGAVALENPANSLAGNILMNRGSLVLLSDAALGNVARIRHDTWNTNGQLRFDADGIVLNAGRTLELVTGGQIMPVNVQTNTATIAGTVTGAGTLYKLGEGTLILAGTNDYSGGTRITAGALQVGTGGTGGGLGAGAVSNMGALVVNRSGTLSVPGAISGTGAVSKLGNGTLVLHGTNPYTGPTLVQSGRLDANGAYTGGAVHQVQAGGTLGGTGTVAALAQVDAGGAIQPGTGLAADALKVNQATLNDGATVNALFSGTGSVLRVLATDGLALPAGAATATINVVNGTLPTGTYTVVDYAGAIQAGSFTNLVLGQKPPRAAMSLVDNAGNTSIDLAITATGERILWTGATDAKWDINTTTNWRTEIGLAATAYLQDGAVGDSVQFDDSAVGNFLVSLGTAVAPAAIVVSNSLNDYTLGGSGWIGGAAVFTKLGTAALVLNTTNSYSGGTRIMGGTLQAGSGGAFGALGSGPITNDGRLIFNHGDAATLGIAVSGTGELVKEGAGALTLAAFNTYTNLTTANGGTLRLAANAAGSGTLSGPLTINTGATVIATVANALGYAGIPWVRSVTINDGTLATAVTGVDNGWGLTINMTGGSLTSLVAGGYFSLGLASVVNVWTTDHPAAISANLTVRDNITFNVQRGSATSDLNVAGALLNTGAFGILKNGAGVMVLGATNTYTGQTTVNGGTLYLADSAKLYHGAYAASAVLTVRSNAVLDLATWAYSEPGAESLGGLRANNNAIVVDGGTIRMRKTTSYYRGFTIGANGVTLETAPGANWSLNFDATTPLVSTLGGSMTLAGEGTGSLHKAMLGSGSLVKTGSGIWTLTATNTYSGTTVVSNGTLVLNGVSGSGAVTVETNATLGGAGVVRGAVVQHGTIDPGAGIGTLTVSNQLSCTGTAVTRFELGGTNAPTDYDQLIVSDIHTPAGTLEVVTTNGYVPASGDSFLIISNSAPGGSLFGTFTTANLPALATGLGWVVQYNGLVSVGLLVTGTVASATPYDLWAQSITNPALRGEQEDADGDGSPNLLEYSQGSDATNAADSAKLTLVRMNGQFLAVFNRVNTATDIVYEVEGAYVPTNGASWLGIATNLIGSWGSSTNVNDDNTAAVHRVLVTDLELGTNRTLRLKITRP
jgi:fibronectin-binding autotransporter adhesin